MSIFDEAGAVNTPDAGGMGAPPVAPPAPVSGFPSAGGAPLPGPSAPASVDPRLQAVLAQLQPKPPAPAWQQALQKIVPALGALYAMKQGAGGAFTNTYQNLQHQQLLDENTRALEQERLSTILHQQAVERATAEAHALAEKRLAAQAAKEEAAKTDRLMRDEWKSQSEGGLIDVLNELQQTQGKDAADRYMASTNIGSLTAAGVPHTVKDLVDRYAVRGPDGQIIGGKTKTEKGAKVGDENEWVTNARQIEEERRGRPLTIDEKQAVTATAIKAYKALSKNPDDAELGRTLKQLQIDLANQEKELRQQRLDKGYQDQYGAAPQIFQHPDGSIHAYVYDKTNNRLVEVPSVLPPGSSRIQPPSAWQKFLNTIGMGSATPPPITKIGGGQDPTDKKWGKSGG